MQKQSFTKSNLWKEIPEKPIDATSVFIEKRKIFNNKSIMHFWREKISFDVRKYEARKIGNKKKPG